eukprot:gene9913-10069_t
MDVEPIYCAEQIQVPPNLADVLRTFAKEVIRNNPANVIEFSSRYFADLAEKHNALHAVVPPGKQQLRQAYLQLKETPKVPLADLIIACQTADITGETIKSVAAAGRINTAVSISILEVLLLLLSMSCESLADTIEGMFEVFGQGTMQQLAVQDFLALLGYLAARDSEISSQLQQEVAGALNGQTHADYSGLTSIPALADKLKGAP